MSADVSVLHSLGFATAAMTLAEDTVPVDEPALADEEKLAVLIGSEGNGLSPRTSAACRYRVKIPMENGVESLNAAAAAAVAFWVLGAKGRKTGR